MGDLGRKSGASMGSRSMAELKAHLGEELVSMAALTWLIGLVQMFYNVWRIFVDHQLLLGITFTRIQPDLGFVFNWDVSNVFLVARFFTNVLGTVAACILTLANCQHMLKRTGIGLEECIAGWRSLTVCQPCVILMEVALAVLRCNSQQLINLLSSFGIPFIFTIYFLFLVESFYRGELKGCLYESLESNNEGEEKRKIKPAKSVYSTYQTV